MPIMANCRHNSPLDKNIPIITLTLLHVPLDKQATRVYDKLKYLLISVYLAIAIRPIHLQEGWMYYAATFLAENTFQTDVAGDILTGDANLDTGIEPLPA